MPIKIPKKKLDKTDEIALHNGFRFSQITAEKIKGDTSLCYKEKEVIVKNIKEKLKKTPDPLFVYHDSPLLVNQKQPLVQRNQRVLNFDIFGISNSIAEVILINTSLKILQEAGYENYIIDINSAGDKDSVVKFKNELLNYYKKNSFSIDNCCKKYLNKKNIMILHCNHRGCQAIQKIAPRPLNFLSKESQRHFKEILEYLEEMNIPYRINDNLVSENNHYSKTIFEIKSQTKKGEVTLARGGRYDEKANKIAGKRNLIAVGVSMQFKKKKASKAYSNKIKEPRIFLIQFGFKAKLKSLEIIDILRQQRITVHQNLHKNRLSEQFEIAKEMKIPYIIVIGQKEAVDDEVIFKNNLDASLRVIKMKKLPQFLKKIKLV